MHVGAASALGAATRAPRCPHAGKGTWRTSSYGGSTGGQCVEVASDAGVMVRDTTDRDGNPAPATDPSPRPPSPHGVNSEPLARLRAAAASLADCGLRGIACCGDVAALRGGRAGEPQRIRTRRT
jgi:hypothetical protein